MEMSNRLKRQRESSSYSDEYSEYSQTHTGANIASGPLMKRKRESKYGNVTVTIFLLCDHL